MKLWGGRFAEGSSATFERFSGSLHFDCRLFEHDVRGSQAYARALRGAGILTTEECAQIVDALADIPPPTADASDEDVHTYVIRELKARAGAVADKIHTGRSRNEQVSLDTRIWLRATIDDAGERLRDLLAALVEMAREQGEHVVPGYTHVRRAQAVLWAHYLLAHFEMFARDHQRLKEARARVNVMPLGSGALAGSGFPVDRQALACELGFDSITSNSMDVAADRDFALDFLYAASTIMLHLSRLAEDWILYSSEEFGWLVLADPVTSGSSLMPQKKNPDSLELIRGKCGRVVGDFTALMMTMKGLPMTYNRDMQEDKEPVFDAADHLIPSLQMATEVVRTARLKPEAALRAAEESWVVATDIAEALARAGVPFHQAHQLTGKLVMQDRAPASWTAEELAALDPRLTPDLLPLLKDPREGMKTRTAPGGTAPSTVDQALKAAESRLKEMAL